MSTTPEAQNKPQPKDQNSQENPKASKGPQHRGQYVFCFREVDHQALIAAVEKENVRIRADNKKALENGKENAGTKEWTVHNTFVDSRVKSIHFDDEMDTVAIQEFLDTIAESHLFVLYRSEFFPIIDQIKLILHMFLEASRLITTTNTTNSPNLPSWSDINVNVQSELIKAVSNCDKLPPCPTFGVTTLPPSLF